jgi:hypothetical protein
MLTTPLAKACQKAFEGDDFCPLCDCHPSSGHSNECPIIREAIDSGHPFVREPEE